MDVSEQLNIDSYLVTIDIHSFLLAVLKAIGFWKYFSHWIEISLTNQGSCVLNGKTTKEYFKLKKEQDKKILYLHIFYSGFGNCFFSW